MFWTHTDFIRKALNTVLMSCCDSLSLSLFQRLTWKTFGALTRLVRAEEIVAAKIPAVTSGPNPDTISITLRSGRMGWKGGGKWRKWGEGWKERGQEEGKEGRRGEEGRGRRVGGGGKWKGNIRLNQLPVCSLDYHLKCLYEVCWMHFG